MRVKASYTVEASMVITFCLMLFGAAVIFSFELFKDCLDYIGSSNNTFDAVGTFRIKEGIMGVIQAIKD